MILDNDCSPLATLKQCQDGETSLSYFGGRHECAQGHSFTKTISVTTWHDQVETVQITGKIWIIDSWTDEEVDITVTNSNGDELKNTIFSGFSDDTDSEFTYH